MTALLSIDDLRVRLSMNGRTAEVLRGVSFTVDPGEAVGVVGESGCGKTMTARAVVRLLPPHAQASGSVRFDGKDVLALGSRPLRDYYTRDVGMIFQDPRAHINPVRTVGEYLIEVMTTNLGVSRKAAMATAAGLLDDVGIAGATRRLQQYPHELSGGMLQRVMIAGALAVNPRLLIADEPTTALDVTTQADLMAILGDMRRERGMAMVFITHNLDLAAAVCDRTVVMYAGSVVEEQSSNALHTRPLHPYTAALAQARPSLRGPRTRLKAISGRPPAVSEKQQGCPFAPRCDFAVDLCSASRPPVTSRDDGRVACHRAAELLSEAALFAVRPR